MTMIHNADRTDAELLREFVFDQYARAELDARFRCLHSEIDAYRTTAAMQRRMLEDAEEENAEKRRQITALWIAFIVVMVIWASGYTALWGAQ